MVGTVVLALMLFQTASTANPTPADKLDVQSDQSKPADKRTELVKVRRVFVESLGTSEAAQQFQAMVVASLTDSKRLTVTEDRTKADAILKGFASEKTSQETHAYGSSTDVATAAGGHSASVSGSHGNISGSSSGGFHSVAGAMNDSSVNTETVDSAKASVRLVNAEGDVIWTATQESNGAKFKGASADVADRIVRQLIRDIEKAERPTSNTSEAK